MEDGHQPGRSSPAQKRCHRCAEGNAVQSQPRQSRARDTYVIHCLLHNDTAGNIAHEPKAGKHPTFIHQVRAQ